MNKIRLLSILTFVAAASIYSANYLNSKGQLCFERDAPWDQVAEACSYLLERDRLSPGERTDVLFRRAFAVKPHHPERAKADYNSVLEADPESVGALNNLGNIYLGQDAPELALPLFERALAIDPTAVHPRRNHGQALYDLERYDEALSDADNILSVEPDHLGAMWLRARSLEALEDYQSALEAYSRLIHLEGDNDKARRKQSWLYYRHLKLPYHALVDLRHILKRKPNDHYTLARLGYVLLKLDRYLEAADAFERSIALKPTYEYAQKGLDRTKTKISERKVANKRLSTPEARELAGPDFGNLLARHFADVGETARALAEFDAVLERSPNNELTYLGKADVYFRLGDDRKVIASTEEYFARLGSEKDLDELSMKVVSSAFTRMGNSYQRLGESENALFSWRSGLVDKDPEVVSLWQLRLNSAGYFDGWPDGQMSEELTSALSLCATDPDC